MRTDYFLEKHIITTYRDHKNNIFQIDIKDMETRITYRITNLEIIEKIKERLI